MDQWRFIPPSVSMLPSTQTLRPFAESIEAIAQAEGLMVRHLDSAASHGASELLVIDSSGPLTDPAKLAASPFIALNDLDSQQIAPLFAALSANDNYSMIAFDLESPHRFAIFMNANWKVASYHTIAQASQSILGYMWPAELELLFNTVQLLPDNAIIVEIGSAYGRSSSAIAFACFGTNRRLFCIDPWHNFYSFWVNNMQRIRANRYIVPIRGLSHEALAKWDQICPGRQIDLFFNDATHGYAETLLEFRMSYPLVKPGGWMGFHDVTGEWPGSQWVWNHMASKVLVEHRRARTMAFGRKTDAPLPVVRVPPPNPAAKDLPIHFFTHVLNGEPFIRRHIETLRQLPFRWHWHIIEGVDAYGFGKYWRSTHTHASLLPHFHRDGLSIDGTSEYLDELAKTDGERVTVYRNPPNDFFIGRLDPFNRPLENIKEECLLWQLEADELWTASHIIAARELFLANPDRTAAAYPCRCHLGPALVSDAMQQLPHLGPDQWVRTWRFRPGLAWFSKEYPVLIEPMPDGKMMRASGTNPIPREQTAAKGIRFENFSYATLKQMHYWEAYCGLHAAATEWLALQATVKSPLNLKDYFEWVGENVPVSRIEPDIC